MDHMPNAVDIARLPHDDLVNKVLGLACLFMDIIVEGEGPFMTSPVANRQSLCMENLGMDFSISYTHVYRSGVGWLIELRGYLKTSP